MPETSHSWPTDGDGDFQGTTTSGKGLRLRVQLDEVMTEFRAHRSRLVAELSELTEKEWNGPTRCHLWSVADVISHLTDSNRWGLEVLHEALRGTESSSMMAFDNRLTPHEYVKAGRGRSRKKIIEDLATGTEKLLMVVGETRDLRAVPFIQAPIGRVSPTLAVLHLLWDSWLHERDVLEPLDRSPVYSANEVRLVASYALLLAGSAISSITAAHQHCDLLLDGAGGGHYRMEIEETIRLSVVMPVPATGAMLQGPILSTIDALAGRGNLRDVVNGPRDAIRLLCVLSVFMAP